MKCSPGWKENVCLPNCSLDMETGPGGVTLRVLSLDLPRSSMTVVWSGYATGANCFSCGSGKFLGMI